MLDLLPHSCLFIGLSSGETFVVIFIVIWDVVSHEFTQWLGHLDNLSFRLLSESDLIWLVLERTWSTNILLCVGVKLLFHWGMGFMVGGNNTTSHFIRVSSADNDYFILLSNVSFNFTHSTSGMHDLITTFRLDESWLAYIIGGCSSISAYHVVQTSLTVIIQALLLSQTVLSEAGEVLWSSFIEGVLCLHFTSLLNAFKDRSRSWFGVD